MFPIFFHGQRRALQLVLNKLSKKITLVHTAQLNQFCTEPFYTIILKIIRVTLLFSYIDNDKSNFFIQLN